MKKINLLLVLVIISISAFTQPRVDGKQQFKVLKSSPIVTNIVGWAYDTQKNKWAGYYNVIWPIYKGNNKVPHYCPVKVD